MLPSGRIPALEAPLDDGTVRLRLAAERDIPEILVAHDDDAELPRHRGLRRPPSGAELGRAIEQAPARRAAGLDAELTIESADGTFEGQVIVHSIDWTDRRAELGLWLRSGARGRGIGRRALALAARWVLQSWGLARLELRTEPGNAAMLACARAAGFHEEGTMRGSAPRGDGAPGRSDEVVLSLLPGEAGDAR